MTKQANVFFAIFLAALWLLVWLLAYGVILSIAYKDSRILHATTTTNIAAPLLQFWHYSDNPALRKVAMFAAFAALLVVSFAAYLIFLRKTQEPLGDASFQTLADLRKRKWFKKKGHIFGVAGGKFLRVLDDRHHLIIGPTRSGKGAGYVIPNALMHVGSMIITDLKGEIFDATAAYRKSTGNQVFLFAPGAEETNRWNPLDFVRQDRGNRTTDIQNIVGILIQENTESENSVWQATAQQVMAGVISYILESPFYENRRNFGEVNSFFNSGEDLQALMRLVKEKEPYLSKFTVESFNAYIALSDKAAASALLDIQKAMKPFKNERVVAATSVTDIPLREMRNRAVSIYLAPHINDVTLLRSLLTLFVQQALELLMRDIATKDAVPFYFLLDEFRQLNKMKEIMNKLPFVAGYKIKMAFIIQDLKNLDEIYGETARHSMLGNCAYQLILGANDQATAEYASRALGKRTIRYQSESRSIEPFKRSRRTMVEQIRDRDLMMPQEIRQMPEDQFVLLVEGQRPIRGTKLRFFEVEPFKSAEAFSKSNRPTVPPIEYAPELAIPALTKEYERIGSEKEVSTASSAVPQPATKKASAPPSRSHIAPIEEPTLPAPPPEISDEDEILEQVTIAQAEVDDSAEAVEELFNVALKTLPRRDRKPIMEIYLALDDDPEWQTSDENISARDAIVEADARDDTAAIENDSNEALKILPRRT